MIALLRRMIARPPAAPAVSADDLAAQHDALFAGLRASRPERQAQRERGWATRRAEARKRDPLLGGRS